MANTIEELLSGLLQQQKSPQPEEQSFLQRINKGAVGAAGAMGDAMRARAGLSPMYAAAQENERDRAAKEQERVQTLRDSLVLAAIKQKMKDEESAQQLQQTMQAFNGGQGLGGMSPTKATIKGVTYERPETEEERKLKLKQIAEEANARVTEFDRQQEERRTQQQQRLEDQFKVGNIETTGGTFTSEDVDRLRKNTGYDVENVAIAYGITPKDDGEGGKVYTIPPKSRMPKALASTEIKYLGDIDNTKKAFKEVLTELQKIGTSGMGPLSLSARIDLAAQLKDPKFASLRKKVERAFQMYRIATTGAQASDKELKTLRPLMPSLTDLPDTFIETANSLINESDRIISDRVQLYKAANRDISGIEKLYGLAGQEQQMSKSERANQIAQQNPSLSRQQIIDMVNQEYSQ